MKFNSLCLARSVQPFVEFRTQNVAGKSDSGGGMRPIEFCGNGSATCVHAPRLL